MRILIINDNFPTYDNLLGDVFVHARVKKYMESNECQVVSLGNAVGRQEYEGVVVISISDEKEFVCEIEKYQPDVVFIHFYNSWMFERIINLNIPVKIWVHGYESLGWYRRLFNYTLYSPVFLKFIYKNIIQQINFRKIVKYSNRSSRIGFVFVSKWMKKIAEQDCLCKIKFSEVIPNPIDTKIFSYSTKDANLRKKILVIRSFSSNKYANDVWVKALQILFKEECFSDLEFTIIGDGPMFDKTLEPIRAFKNIKIIRKIVPNKEIPAIHKKHGIFLCPTRQDAQGVSMCEAMSSGLVPITSDNTAIPEFVKNEVSGMLTDTPEEISRAIVYLYENPKIFSEISMNAAKSIRNQCDMDEIVSRELKSLHVKE